MTSPSSAPDALAILREAYSKCPEGPWFAVDDPADDAPDHKNSGLACVDTGRQSDWPIARLCEWSTAKLIAMIPDIISALEAHDAQIEQLNKNIEAWQECVRKITTISNEQDAQIKAMAILLHEILMEYGTAELTGSHCERIRELLHHTPVADLLAHAKLEADVVMWALKAWPADHSLDRGALEELRHATERLLDYDDAKAAEKTGRSHNPGGRRGRYAYRGGKTRGGQS